MAEIDLTALKNAHSKKTSEQALTIITANKGMVLKALLIKNGTCLTDKGPEKVDLYIEGGKIKQIKKHLDFDDRIDIIDAEDKIVFPGAIDTQVHFREPGLTHKEDLETGSKSCVLGGVTTFLEMPNTNPACDTVSRVQEKINLASEKSYANFGFFIGATANNYEELLKIEGMTGCPGVKVFLGSSTGDLLLYDPEILLKILKNVKTPIAFHSENEQRLVERKSIKENAKDVHAHYEWRDAEAAMSSTRMIIELAEKANKNIHLLHISTKDEMEFLKDKKHICTVEVTPQHLSFHAPAFYDKLGTYAQMNPPIRTEEHQQGLWEGVHNGTVDVIGSDHAPHLKEEKEKGYPHSPSGMPGAQTIFPVMLDYALNGKITLEKLAELMCFNPAKLYSLKNKGHLRVGFDADIIIFDPNREDKIVNGKMASKCGWTPFDQRKVKGKITHTIVAGKKVVVNGEIVDGPNGAPIELEK